MNSMFNIDKLCETNYDTWSLQIKAVLLHQDLWDIASKEEIKLDDADWKKRDEKALSTIILAITPTQLSHIKNCKTANDAWTTLNKIHRPKGPVRKVSLFKQLIGMRMCEEDCIQEYICKFTSVVEKMTEIGIELQEDFLVIMMMASLPKSFENFVVALETRDDLLTLNALKAKLVEEEQRRKTTESNNNNEDPVQVFMAQSKKNSHLQRNTNSDNTVDSNSYRVTTNNSKNVKCYNCRRRGHYASQCKNKHFERKNEQRKINEVAYSVLAAIDNQILNSKVWCLDSGASSHLCCDRNLFETYDDREEFISLAGQNRIKAIGRGRVRINGSNIRLNNVLYVPELQCNFISIGKVAAVDVVKFNASSAKILRDGKTILTARRVGNLFLYADKRENLFFSGMSTEAVKWHMRYGHLNIASLQQLAEKEMVQGMKIKFPLELSCSVCMKSKSTVKPFTRSETRARELLEVIHTDICGPINTASLGGARYILTFIDDKSRFVFVYFLKNTRRGIRKI